MTSNNNNNIKIIDPVLRLIPADPKDSSIDYKISLGVNKIGRASSNNIYLKGQQSVSNFHAQLDYNGSSFYLKDLNSLNKTLLQLKPGSEVIMLKPNIQSPIINGSKVSFGAATCILSYFEIPVDSNNNSSSSSSNSSILPQQQQQPILNNPIATFAPTLYKPPNTTTTTATTATTATTNTTNNTSPVNNNNNNSLASTDKEMNDINNSNNNVNINKRKNEDISSSSSNDKTTYSKDADDDDDDDNNNNKTIDLKKQKLTNNEKQPQQPQQPQPPHDDDEEEDIQDDEITSSPSSQFEKDKLEKEIQEKERIEKEKEKKEKLAKEKEDKKAVEETTNSISQSSDSGSTPTSSGSGKSKSKKSIAKQNDEYIANIALPDSSSKRKSVKPERLEEQIFSSSDGNSNTNNTTTTSSPKSSSSSSPKSTTKRPDIKILFSMFTEDTAKELENICLKLGASIANSSEECTHLVCDEMKRSKKILECITYGKLIITSKWLKESKKSGKFLDELPFNLLDKKAENEWNFNLEKSLNIARNRINNIGSQQHHHSGSGHVSGSSNNKPLFNNLLFFITKNSIPPKDFLKDIIEINGGKIFDDISKIESVAKDNETIVVIANADKDKRSFKKWSDSSFKILKGDFILLSILSQQLVFEGCEI